MSIAKQYATNTLNNNDTKNNSNNHTKDIISELLQFGYSPNQIINAMNDMKNKTDINNIVKYIHNTSQKPRSSLSIHSNKLPLKPASLHSINSLIHSLPTSAPIKLHQSTSYWCISLGQQWQNQSINIAKLSYLFIKDSSEYLKSINMGKSWASLVNTANAKIQCVTPPSVAGLHISLGNWSKNDKERPKCLIEQEMVSFKIKNIKAFPSIRKLPQNIEGQYTNDKGLRYYPTLWILADIEFIDFEYITKYTPHISLACVAVQLDVKKVEGLKNNTKNTKDTEKEYKDNDNMN